MSGIGARRAWAEEKRNGFEARYGGWCRVCPNRYEPTDRIVPVTGGGFAHIDCVKDEKE